MGVEHFVQNCNITVNACQKQEVNTLCHKSFLDHEIKLCEFEFC